MAKKLEKGEKPKKVLLVLDDCWSPSYGEFKRGKYITDPALIEALKDGQMFKLVDPPAEAAVSKEG